MAQTVSITDKGNGQYVITDSDGQTRVVDQTTANAEAKKANVKITVSATPTPTPTPNPTPSLTPTPKPGTAPLPDVNAFKTGYSNNPDGGYPTGDPQGLVSGKKVLVNGKVTDPTDAVTQAQGAKNLGLIRANLVKYGQLTKAEANDPTKLLAKWSEIVTGASNDPNVANHDPFVYAAALQKQGFGTSGAAGTGTGGYGGPLAYPTITSAEDAKSEITKIWQSQLNRLPTTSEIAAEIGRAHV